MLDDLKRSNRDWAAGKIAADPGFFKRLVAQQAPQYFWIGCSDSRVPANEIVGLDPGEMFVHRNVANLAPPQDANYLSVLQFAVDVLKVRHILVVGHYGCGGVAAAVDGKRRGLVDHWVQPIREVAHAHRHELDALPEGTKVMLKLTIPDQADLYAPLAKHPGVVRVVALSGGYARADACARLARDHGMIASFSRALIDDLKGSMSDAAFDATLGEAIDEIYRASTEKV